MYGINLGWATAAAVAEGQRKQAAAAKAAHDKEKAEREEFERQKVAQDRVAAMQAKYPQLKECVVLVRLGLTAADKVRTCRTICHIKFCTCIRLHVYKIAWSFVALIGNV